MRLKEYLIRYHVQPSASLKGEKGEKGEPGKDGADGNLAISALEAIDKLDDRLKVIEAKLGI